MTGDNAQSPSTTLNLSSKRSRPVICPVCSKSFSRRDVLTRHIKSKHQNDGVVAPKKRSRRKSCLRCAFYKIKCSGSPSCNQCEKNRIVCQFHFSAKESGGEQQDLVATDNDDSEVQHAAAAPVISEPDTRTDLTLQAPATALSPTVSHHSGQCKPGNVNEQEPPASFADYNYANSEDIIQLELPVQQDMSLEEIASLLDRPLSSYQDRITEPRATPLPWLWSNGASGSPFAPQCSEVPFIDMEEGREVSNEEETNESQSLTSSGAETDNMFDYVLRFLEPLVSPGYKSLLLHVPAVSATEIAKFWDFYFENFHKTFPVIHPASTEMERTHPLLVGVITAIGATYSSDPTAGEYHIHVLTRIIILLSHKPGETQRIHELCDPLTVLLCQCIAYYFIIKDSSGMFHPWAIAGQEYMVNAARNEFAFRCQREPSNGPEYGIGTPPSDISTLDCSLSPQDLLDQDLGEATIHNRWLEWIATEKRSRLGWAVVAVHSLYHIRTNCPFRLRFEHLDLYLPYEEKMWEATDAKGWRRQFPWTDRPPRTLPLQGAVRMLAGYSCPQTDLPTLAIVVMESLVELVRRSKREQVEVQSFLNSESAGRHGWYSLADQIFHII